MLIEIVKWFDSEKGFGVVGTPDEGDFFLHIKSFVITPQTISKGTSILFSKKIDRTKIETLLKIVV